MQKGSLIKSNRKHGPDVWQFLWAERGPQGKRIYRERVTMAWADSTGKTSLKRKTS